LRLKAALPRDAMPEPPYTTKLLRIQMQQIARASVLIPLHEQGRGEATPAGQAAPPQNATCGGRADADGRGDLGSGPVLEPEHLHTELDRRRGALGTDVQPTRSILQSGGPSV